VHWKDLPEEFEAQRGKIYGCGMSVTTLGQGVIGIEAIYNKLVSIGFNGYSTLEIAGEDAVKGSYGFLKNLGADYVFDYTQPDWTKQFKELLPEGADLVYDCVGKETNAKAYKLTKEGGMLVSILAQPNIEMANKYNINVKYLFVEPNAVQLDKIRDWIEKGKIKLHVDQVFDLQDAAKAHEKIETGHTLGKIVLRVD